MFLIESFEAGLNLFKLVAETTEANYSHFENSLFLNSPESFPDLFLLTED